MSATRYALFTAMLFSAVAQAGVYECQSPSGEVTYSQKPCPAGIELSVKQPATATPPAAPPAPSPAPATERHLPPGWTINGPGQPPRPAPVDIEAGQLSQTQRSRYQEFLTRPSPRAFAICKNGGTIAIVGSADFVQREMKDIQFGCKLYAVSD
jgi:hypothetical protein